MLIYNPKRMFAMREIEKPHQALIKAGISATTATKLLGGYNVRLTIEHLQKMCEILNCTPNDLFEWRDNKDSSIQENHALVSLKREPVPPSLTELMREIPVEKLQEVKNMLLKMQDAE